MLVNFWFKAHSVYPKVWKPFLTFSCPSNREEVIENHQIGDSNVGFVRWIPASEDEDSCISVAEQRKGPLQQMLKLNPSSRRKRKPKTAIAAIRWESLPNKNVELDVVPSKSSEEDIHKRVQQQQIDQELHERELETAKQCKPENEGLRIEIGVHK